MVIYAWILFISLAVFVLSTVGFTILAIIYVYTTSFRISDKLESYLSFLFYTFLISLVISLLTLLFMPHRHHHIRYYKTHDSEVLPWYVFPIIQNSELNDGSSSSGETTSHSSTSEDDDDETNDEDNNTTTDDMTTDDVDPVSPEIVMNNSKIRFPQMR